MPLESLAFRISLNLARVALGGRLDGVAWRLISRQSTDTVAGAVTSLAEKPVDVSAGPGRRGSATARNDGAFGDFRVQEAIAAQ
jgi:hypothetical protein